MHRGHRDTGGEAGGMGREIGRAGGQVHGWGGEIERREDVPVVRRFQQHDSEGGGIAGKQGGCEASKKRGPVDDAIKTQKATISQPVWGWSATTTGIEVEDKGSNIVASET